VSHIPEGDLALYAFSPEAVPADRLPQVRRHIALCSECQATVDFFATAEEDLGDLDVWEPIVGSATYTSLMEYGARVAAEDQEAALLLEKFLESPANAAWTALATRRRFRTGGVVRKLCGHAHSLCESDPLAALTFADAAIGVSEVLPDDLYPARAVDQLRATSWKERANALMRLGQFPAALDSLDRAERLYRRLPGPALGLAIVALVRAGVLYEQQRLEEAAALAEQAERSFDHLGDAKRRADALFLRAGIRYEARDLDTAVSLFRQIVDSGEENNEIRRVAHGSHGAGVCEVERGNLGEASLHFHKALVIFREIGPERFRIATEWGLARVVLRGGKLDEAIRRLRAVAADFERIGMLTDVALVGLETAEAWLAIGRPKEIVELGRHLFTVFTKAGMLTGALTAIAYMKEAAAERRLTGHDIDAIRAFLRRAERQPTLQFIPPPSVLE
jgi:tetratricopeptide (TPR) repeat protein